MLLPIKIHHITIDYIYIMIIRNRTTKYFS